MKETTILVGTDTFNKKGSPHLMVTSIICDDINKRENKYKDVVGFYKYIEDSEDISETIIKDMDDWADILKKNILCLIENKDNINGWLFKYHKNDISYQEVQVFTLNDVNYDIWLDSESSFWNPVDFLLDGEYFSSYSTYNEDAIIIDSKLDSIENRIETLNTNILKLIESIKILSIIQPKRGLNENIT